MSEPHADDLYERLDCLVDADPIGLRDVAWAEIRRLNAELARRDAVLATIPDLMTQRDNAIAEAAEYRATFDLQWTRTGEATARWRAEAPEERALLTPDLGALLQWLLDRTDSAEAETKELRAALDPTVIGAEQAEVERLRAERDALAISAERHQQGEKYFKRRAEIAWASEAALAVQLKRAERVVEAAVALHGAFNRSEPRPLDPDYFSAKEVAFDSVVATYQAAPSTSDGR